jgi:cytochrome c553
MGSSVVVRCALVLFVVVTLGSLGGTTARADDATEIARLKALEGCYTCHKASDKPYLRPRIPEAPEAKIINFDPAAVWP